MKNFLSQTWVTSALVILAIALIAYPLIKTTLDDKQTDTDSQSGTK